MSKRKLSRQQRWRIEKVQQERAERAAKKAQRIESQLNEGELGEEQEGLVIAHFGQQLEIEAGDGSRQRCHVRANVGSLVTGDKVVWRAGQPTGVVIAQQPRDSLLSRPNAHGELKAVAANIDNIALVIAPEPLPHPNLIDRYLVAAEAIGIRPSLVLNKCELDIDERLDAMMRRYQTLGYQVTRSSTKRQDGLNELKQYLENKVSVFVGQSGVGKSSLVNVLLPGTDARVGELSEAHAQGRHTTTTARLFHFPDGGQLIDSPGIREFGLINLDREQVEQGFIEFRPHLGLCKFRDCHHEQEPGCALLQALDDGAIDPARMDSYRQILASLEEG